MDLSTLVTYDKKESLLLSIAKSNQEIVENTHSKPQEILEFKMTKQKEVSFSFDVPLILNERIQQSNNPDPSETGLSEREIRKRTDPELMAPIPGPDSQLQEVKDLWGTSACESLGKILNEFDDLFMKYKADIGRCTIAKHTVEVEPGVLVGCPLKRLSVPIKRCGTSWPWG